MLTVIGRTCGTVEHVTRKAVLWQRWARQAHDVVGEELADGRIRQAKEWQEIAAGDHESMWEYLSQLI